MSKHDSADVKLHVTPTAKAQKKINRVPAQVDKAAPQVPAPGANARNQYR